VEEPEPKEGVKAMKKNELVRKISMVTLAAALMAGGFAGPAMAAAPEVNDEPDLVVEEIEYIVAPETVVAEAPAQASAGKTDTETPAAKMDEAGTTSEQIAASELNVSVDVAENQPEAEEEESAAQAEGEAPAADAEEEKQAEPAGEEQSEAAPAEGNAEAAPAEGNAEVTPAEEQSESAPVAAEAPANPAETPAEPQPAAAEAPAADALDTPLGDKAFEYEYEKDDDGILILNENSDPIAILKDGQDIPVSWLRRANGELILDPNGNPVATQAVPQKAVHVETLRDRLNDNRAIDIYVTFEKDGTTLGESAKLTAVLSGYDALVYTLQWQQSDDGEHWENVGAANEKDLEIITSEDNRNDYWRVRVTITGLAG